MREIRERDRMLNQHQYPKLFYPEIYLLEGGYKNFYEQHDVCIFFIFKNLNIFRNVILMFVFLI